MMEYTEYGLRIGLEELQQLLHNAQTAAKYHNMEGCVYIKGGKRPTIKQYCLYKECNPRDYTYGVKDE